MVRHKFYIHTYIHLKHLLAVFEEVVCLSCGLVYGPAAVEQFVDSDRRCLLGLELNAQSLLYIRHIHNWIYDGRLSKPPSAATVWS